VNKAT
jgi:hypothetical protein